MGEVEPFGLFERGGVGGIFAWKGNVGVGFVIGAVGGVVGGDVFGVAGFEIEFFEEALGGEDGLAEVGGGEFEGVEFGGEGGGVGKGVCK